LPLAAGEHDQFQFMGSIQQQAHGPLMLNLHNYSTYSAIISKAEYHTRKPYEYMDADNICISEIL